MKTCRTAPKGILEFNQVEINQSTQNWRGRCEGAKFETSTLSTSAYERIATPVRQVKRQKTLQGVGRVWSLRRGSPVTLVTLEVGDWLQMKWSNLFSFTSSFHCCDSTSVFSFVVSIRWKCCRLNDALSDVMWRLRHVLMTWWHAGRILLLQNMGSHRVRVVQAKPVVQSTFKGTEVLTTKKRYSFVESMSWTLYSFSAAKWLLELNGMDLNQLLLQRSGGHSREAGRWGVPDVGEVMEETAMWEIVQVLEATAKSVEHPLAAEVEVALQQHTIQAL